MFIALSLVLLGLLCVYLEFFLPGGVLAVIGGVLVLTAIVFYGWQEGSILGASLFLLGAGISTYFVCRYALYRIKKTREKDSFFLQRDQEGHKASFFDDSLIGKEGDALTDLKPAGHVTVEGKSYQALSERGYINKGVRVRIIGGRASYLLVKELS